MDDSALMSVAEDVGRKFGMSGSQMMQHLALGDIPHQLAPDSECGMTDPRDDKRWCRRIPGHTGDHNWYLVGV